MITFSGIIGGSLMTALPCAIAIFPQVASISVDRLEDQFKKMNSDGSPITEVYYNRGL